MCTRKRQSKTNANYKKTNTIDIFDNEAFSRPTQNTQHVALPFRISLVTGIAGTERLLFLGRIIVREFEKILFHS